MNTHLSFSIGPVQTFVAQARRTRDLWAGSWLLSYLAECALVAAEHAGGEAVIPHRATPKIMTSQQTPVGGIPNRFEVRFSGDDARDVANSAAAKAERAFNDAWSQIADAVWKQYVAPAASQGNNTQAIWQRQVDNFWELGWVIGEADENTTIGHLAAARKQFRNVAVADEPGVKCSLMPTLQELSGHLYKPKQDAFWKAFRSIISTHDLGESERLCAIALIKRLFPHVIQDATGATFTDEQRFWPSTAFVAATPWLKQVDGNADWKAKAETFQTATIKAGYRNSEQLAANAIGIPWASADGPIWFTSAIRNDEPGVETVGAKPSSDQKSKRDATVADLVGKLKDVYRKPNSELSIGPVPFYAMLLMDGDEMGQLLAALKTPTKLSKCLNDFSGGVNDVVRQHEGRTVYAGGDDVLAILPANDALTVATLLRDQYQQAFAKEEVPKDVATISAAVVFAHWKYPLRLTLRTAHHLLDDIAKDRTGRDAVAIGTILSGGLNAAWAVPWEVYDGTAVSPDGVSSAAMQTLVERFESAETERSADRPLSAESLGDFRYDDSPFSASYLYLLRERFGELLHDIRERFGELLHNIRDQPGTFTEFDVASGSAGAADLLRDLAHAEYRRRMSKTTRAETLPADTQPLIENLMSLSRQWVRQRNENGSPEFRCHKNTFGFDGWRVARFLKQIKDGKVSDRD